MAETKVRGADRLAATLRAAGNKLGDMTQASTTAAQAVTADAKSKAPRRTGRLAASIVGEGRRNTARVTAGAPYAAYVEFGTARVPARPYMRPALAARQAQIVDAYAAETDRIIGTVKGA